ncbi:amidohydrolase [Corallibacter sp.]|uniref:amidohydrolase n=1 Tax=Corallibacter sp. TaxID=2038084 RepID=UPI003AB44F07
MQDQLKVAFIQAELFWENPIENRAYFENKIAQLPNEVDVVLLPEMFTTGFTMNAKSVAETMNGDTVSWMKTIAKTHNIALAGSLVIEEDACYYNRLLFVKPDETLEVYDKRHTFTLAGEDKVYTSGTKKQIVTYKGWKLCLMVCYDLRFPVWARNTDDYDVLIYVANWPKPRIAAWDALLKARAIENMCYVIGVNRVGYDEKQNEYCGHSAVYDVLGTSITALRPNKAYTETVILERNHINFYRNKLKFLQDRDLFTLE